MTQIKSPYLVPELRNEYYSYHKEFPAERLQYAIRLKPMPRQRKQTRFGLLWGFAINCALCGLIGGGIYWLDLLGFWSWIRGWFR